MRKVTMIILLLATSNAMAGWTKLEDPNAIGFTLYANHGFLSHKGASKVKMQHLINLDTQGRTSNGQTYLSRKELVEYDCDEEHYRVLAYSLFTGAMGRGKIVGFSTFVELWQPVEFNTLEETLWKVACDKPGIMQHD